MEFGELMYLALELNKALAPKPKVLFLISKIGKIKVLDLIRGDNLEEIQNE